MSQPSPGEAALAGLVVPVEGVEAFRAEVIESTLPVVVDFGARWCAPCNAIEPVLAELARELAGQVKVVRVDTDANQDLALAYDVRKIPTLCLFAPGGRLERTLVGAHPKKELREHARALLGPAA